MRRDGVRSTIRLAVWTAGLLVVARLLVAAGAESLSVPLTSLDDLSVWLSETPPADMAMALLRLAALGTTGYLLAVTVLAVVARVVRARGLAAAVDWISPGVVRRVVAGGSGIGLALGAVVGSLPSPDLAPSPDHSTVASASPPAGSAPSVATMSRLPDDTATMTRIDGSAPPTATMTRLDPAIVAVPPPAAPPVDTTPAGAARAAYGADGDAVPALTPTAPVASTVPEIDPTSWVVEPGDSLWSIAEEVVTPPGGPAPGERVVSRYWRRLVEANRAQLVDPGNADLLVPGQRLVVPPLDV